MNKKVSFNQNLHSFLKFGYFLDYDNPRYSLDFTGIDKEKYADWKEGELIREGVIKLKVAMESNFEKGKKHVVPISGGMDSRAILASLLEFTGADNIYSYTFGTPGTLDFEIGNMVASSVGTNHTEFPLDKYEYTLEKEINVSRRIDHQTYLFHHPPMEKLEELYNGMIIWSGYIGDWFAGSHLPDIASDSTEDAKNKLIKGETLARSVQLSNLSDDCFHGLFECDFFEKEILSYEEQIEAKHKLIKNTAPHILYKGFRYKIPLVDTHWTDFILSIDNLYRRDLYLYIKILLEAFPNYFSLPVKNNIGLPLDANRYKIFKNKLADKFKNKLNRFGFLSTNENINYIDFKEAIRNREDFKTIIYENIMDLKNRKIVDWINIEKLWKEHINGKIDHSKALMILASLEIHFKAGKKL